jgi:RNA:NAD 2'-phosphotransferase (TPT1/KptA family)
MKKAQRRHVRSITDVEEQRDVIHHHKIQMILAKDRNELHQKGHDFATNKS